MDFTISAALKQGLTALYNDFSLIYNGGRLSGFARYARRFALLAFGQYAQKSLSS
jgi:hypothetical protein